MNEKTDPRACAQAQKLFCIVYDLPIFAPHDGICEFCHRQIYEDITVDGGISHGIDFDAAGRSYITGCPHCNHTFCD